MISGLAKLCPLIINILLLALERNRQQGVLSGMRGNCERGQLRNIKNNYVIIVQGLLVQNFVAHKRADFKYMKI